MLNETGHIEREKYYVTSFIVKSENIRLIEREIRWWLPGVEGSGKWRDRDRRVETLSQKISSGDLNYALVTVVNDTLFCTLL